MFEKLQLTMKCQSWSIRRNWFFLWALKRPFELISSLASSLFPQTVSDPMRLQFEKREFISFRLFSSFQNPFHWDQVACRAQCGLWHWYLRVKRLVSARPTRILARDSSGSLQDKAAVCLSHSQWARAVLLSLRLVCLEGSLGLRVCSPGRELMKIELYFVSFLVPKACGIEVSVLWRY